jgi:outer membrane lipoprotein-sorting protein
MRALLAPAFFFANCFFILSTSTAVAASAAAINPQKLLQDSDRSRGGIKEGLSWKSKVTTTEDGEKTEREFLVKAKGNDAYVEAAAPARTKGEVFIFNDRTMWFYKPSLKKPVSISPRQKLSGQAANGDIASTNYARDYTPTLERSEQFEGKKTHVLLLKAKAPNLTYEQIRYWIDDQKSIAVKAEFLTLQGAVFKVAKIEYGNNLVIEGKSLPFVHRMTITDAKFQNNSSIIEYDSPKIEEHPASLFNVNNLAR